LLITDIQTMKLNDIFVETNHILVFRSNIDDKYKATKACVELEKIEGVHRVNVDLNDWENILRLECGLEISEHRVQQAISHLGFVCEEL